MIKKENKVSLKDIQSSRATSNKLSAVTCYDSSFARIIENTTIDIVLVGDSLGNVMLGFDNTINVTMTHMIHHTAAVSRVLRRPFLCADMPFLSYNLSVSQALENAGRLIQEGGAEAVKLEGGEHVLAQVETITKAGIPVMGHLGFTPQSLLSFGGYYVQGRGKDAHKKILDDAKALEQAGAFSIVLEMMPADLAKEITATLKIPTIGIGAGPYCDGQILVLHDLLGFDDSFNPTFLKKYANLNQTIKNALKAYDEDVKKGNYPDLEHSFRE